MQDDTVARRAGNRDEGPLGILKRIDRRRIDRERFQVPARKTGPEFPQDRAGRDRRQRERIDADIGVLAAIEFQDIELHDTVDRGDQDLRIALPDDKINIPIE